MSTQTERVLDILHDRQWHCGDEFLAAYMPRYSAVIYNLRRPRGEYDIEGVPCTLHPNIEKHSVYMFKITRAPDTATKEQFRMPWAEESRVGMEGH